MLKPPKFDQVSDSESFYLEKSETSENSDVKPHSPQTLMIIVNNMKSLLNDAHDLIERVQIAAGLRTLEKLSLLSLKLNYLRQNFEFQQSKNNTEIQQIEILCLYYKSFALNYLQKYEGLLKNNELVIQKFKQIIHKKQQMLKNNRYSYENNPQKMNQKARQMKSYRMQQTIKYQILLVHFLLFASFRQSKSQNHKNAFQYAKESHKILINIFIFFKNEHPRLSTRFFTNEKVQFSKIILQKSVPIIKQILKLQGLQSIQQSDNLQTLKNSLSNWGKKSFFQPIDLNLSQYCQMNNTLLQGGTVRNILGVKIMENSQSKDDEQLQSKLKNIKDVFVLKLVSLSQFQRNDNLIYHLSPFQVKYKVQLLCTSYFSMGYQLWMISASKNHLNKGLNNQNIYKKRSVNNLKQIKLSQMFQLKAIFIAMQYLNQNKSFIESLTQNYRKAYGEQMPTIIEQSSKFQQSSSIAQKISNAILSTHVQIENNRKVDKQISIDDIYYARGHPFKGNNCSKNNSQKKVSMKSNSNKKSYENSKSKNSELSKKKFKSRSSTKFKNVFNNIKQTTPSTPIKPKKKHFQKFHSEKKIIIKSTKKIMTAENIELN